MEKYDNELATRFAMNLGLRVGLVWIVSFCIVVFTFPSFLSEVGLLTGLMALPIAGLSLRRLKSMVEDITTWRLAWVSWYTYMCAVLLLTAAQYVYFAFLDKGRLLRNMTELYSSPETTEALQQAGATDMLNVIQESLEQMGEMTTKDMMMGFLLMNMMMGVAFALLSMLFTIRSKR